MSHTGPTGDIRNLANLTIVLAEEFTPREFHNLCGIVQDMTRFHDVIRPCALNSEAVFEEIESIIQLVMGKL